MKMRCEFAVPIFGFSLRILPESSISERVKGLFVAKALNDAVNGAP